MKASQVSQSPDKGTDRPATNDSLTFNPTIHQTAQTNQKQWQQQDPDCLCSEQSVNCTKHHVMLSTSHKSTNVTSGLHRSIFWRLQRPKQANQLGKQRLHLCLNKDKTRLARRKIQLSEERSMVWSEESNLQWTNETRRQEVSKSLGTDKNNSSTIISNFWRRLSSKIGEVVMRNRKLEK